MAGDYIPWLRSRIGTQRTILVYATVVLSDAGGRILLQRRTDFNWWGLPGGALEPGENILDCARRELLEETGLQAGELRLVGIYTDPAYESTYPNGDQVQQFAVCFAGQVAAGQPQPDGVETRALEFVPLERLPRHDMPAFYIAMVDDVQRAGAAPSFEPPFARPQTVDPIKLLRSLIGHDLFIGAGAIGVVTDPAGRLLVVRARDYEAEWSLPGGFVNLGENAAHTVVREIAEETGLQVAPERLMGIDSPVTPWTYPNGDMVQTLGAVFCCRLTGGALHPQASEITAINWLSPAGLVAQTRHPDRLQLNRAVAECLERGVFII